MTTIVTRAGKGSPLTNNEVDANFTNLNDAKIETLTSTDSSVTITGTGSSRDLSVPVNPNVVSGPASATDNAVARFDTTTGKLIQNSVVTVDDSGNMAGVNSITDPDTITFNTAYATPLTAGQLGWDGNNTLGLGMAGGNVIQHIGEDQFFYCKASSAITKGQVVMFTGAVGASGVPTGAPATGITDGTYIMGIAAETIALNGFGLVQCFGVLRNVNTTGYTDGQILWYNPAVAGGLTATKPTAPNVKVQVAAVMKGGSSGGGTILIRISAGSTLGGTDSNAQINGAANGQIITYDGTNSYFKNTSVGSGTGISVSASATGVLTVTNTAPDQTVAITGAGGASVTGTYPNFTITTPSGTVTSVTGTAPVVSSGGNTPAISLDAAYGDTLNPYASKTANYVLAAPNGSAGVPTFRAIVADDIPTLNQNTTGQAGKVANALTAGTGISFSSGTTYDGSAAITINSSVTSPIPTGTVMLFYQASAPTGWTQVTTQNNKALRVVSGTGGGTGGTTAFTSVFTNQTPTFTGSNGTLAVANTTAGGSVSLSAGGSVGATTLSAAQMPSHSHTARVDYPIYSPANGFGTGSPACASGTATTNGAGSSASHTHGFTNPTYSFGGTAHNHTFTGTISGTVGAVTLNVQYIDIIICSKD